MKKISSLTVAFTFIILFSHAQQPANPGFENWTQKTLYEDPVSLTTSNQWTYTPVGMGNVKKVSGSYHGLYAAELTTVQTGTDTISGILIIGTPVQGGVNGGIPYTGQPDSISGYVTYNIQPNDTAFFIIGFKNNGTIMALAVNVFTGSQATYKRFSMPTNLPVSPAPDSMVVIISSSNLDPPRYPGSTFTVDSITFIGSTQGFPNPSFENWTPKISEEPDNWTTINFASVIPSATKSTSSYNGTYALRLETVVTTWGDTMGFITNGYIGNDGPQGGIRVYANPMKITGYYKYTPVGLDTALAAGTSYIGIAKVDSNLIALSPTNTYTYFEVPMSYNAFPYIDTFNIAFASSNIEDSTSFVGLGSVLYLDNISIVYMPVGTEDEYIGMSHTLFPNPFSDMAILTFDNRNGANQELFIYGLLGNMVMKKENITSSSVAIQRSNLPAGIYGYSIRETKGGKIAAQGKLVIE